MAPVPHRPRRCIGPLPSGLGFCPIKSAQRAIIKAAGEGVLPVRGRLATDAAYRSEAAVRAELWLGRVLRVGHLPVSGHLLTRWTEI